MISVVLSYFRQPEALEWQIEHYESLKRIPVELVLVDDASRDNFALKRLRQSRISGVFVEIQDRVPWNIPGARNWGMVFSSNDACLRTDIDHVPTGVTLELLDGLDSIRGEALRFRRVTTDGKVMHPHSDSFFLSKRDYWEIGGYDERFAGAYGQNARDFEERAAKKIRLIQTNLLLETNRNLTSGGGSRNLARNQILRRLTSLERPRKLKHLDGQVKVTAF